MVFHSITFEKIGELDSYFIHKHIIIICRSSLIKGKIRQSYLELQPFFNVEKSFSLISFENISVLNSNLTYRYIIIK